MAQMNSRDTLQNRPEDGCQYHMVVRERSLDWVSRGHSSVLLKNDRTIITVAEQKAWLTLWDRLIR